MDNRVDTNHLINLAPNDVQMGDARRLGQINGALMSSSSGIYTLVIHMYPIELDKHTQTMHKCSVTKGLFSRDVRIFRQVKSLTSTATQSITRSGLTCLRTIAVGRLAASQNFSSSRPAAEVFGRCHYCMV